MSLRARFYRFVPVREPGRCWLWTGAKDRDGYGVIADGGKTLLAHRVSFELHKRPIPPRALLMHSCDNPPCCNPEHLSLGSKRSNAADMTAKGRRAAKLTRMQVLEIRARHEDGVAALAVEFGVSESTIRSVLAGKSWR